jgi:hypothetical protein
MQLDPCANSVHYRAYGLILASDTPLLELTPIARAEFAADADVRVRFLGNRQEFSLPPQWFMSWTLPAGELWLQCAKDKHGYLLRFPEIADFCIDSEGREIICTPEPETPMETLGHLLLDQVLPLVLNLKGREALHATAILTPLGVCAFTGPAGTGKSTLAASFLRAGYPVLSDDCLVLEEANGRIFAIPAYPGLRLWEDTLESLGEDHNPSLPVAHYTSKKRLVLDSPLSDFPKRSYPVVRIYSLVRSDVNDGNISISGTIIERLSLRVGFMELIQTVFRLDINDRSMLVRQFCLLERIVSRVPVRRLHVPDTFSSLPAVREAILSDLMRDG